MNVKVIQGSRSEKYLAESWKCTKCSRDNKPTHHMILDLTVYRCPCGELFDGLIYFCLADIEVNGHTIVPPAKNQGNKEECISFAFCHGKELTDNVESIMLGESPSNKKLDPMNLASLYTDSFPVLPTTQVGLHKLLYIGLLLREVGCKDMNGGEKSKISDFFTIPLGNMQMSWEMVADGRAVVVTFLCSRAISKLQFGDVYDPYSVDHPKNKEKILGHAVLLIGAITFGTLIIDIFLNSHGEQFCARRNAAGEIVIGGIGMTIHRRLCNPIVICRSWEKVLNGRIEGSWNVDCAETEIDLELYSGKGKRGINYILGVAHDHSMAGVNVSAGMPSLVVAATHGLADCIKCLLEAGADPNVPDDIGRMPIEIAALQGWRECAEILFPLTSCIAKFADWSIDGVMKNAKNDGFSLEVQGDAAFRGQDNPQEQLTAFRPEFTSGLDAFTKCVFDRTRPKQLGTSTMTGPILAGLAQSFLDAINTGVVPTISSSWQSVEETECRRAYDSALDIYNSSFNHKKTAEGDALREAHESARNKAISAFIASALGAGSARLKFEKLLQTSLRKSFEDFKRNTFLEADLQCSNRIQSMESKVLRAFNRPNSKLDDVVRVTEGKLKNYESIKTEAQTLEKEVRILEQEKNHLQEKFVSECKKFDAADKRCKEAEREAKRAVEAAAAAQKDKGGAQRMALIEKMERSHRAQGSAKEEAGTGVMDLLSRLRPPEGEKPRHAACIWLR